MITFRPYQTDAAGKLAGILDKRSFALDGSDTGVGKTFTAIATALQFFPDRATSHAIGVVCRARAVTKWTEALRACGITKPLFVMSWEKARNGRNATWFRPLKNHRRKTQGFNLQLAQPSFLIFDEIHAAGGLASLNSELVIAARRCPMALVLGLSATPAESPLKMRALGFCMNLHSLGSDYWNWCRRNGCAKSPWGGLYFRAQDAERVMLSLHEQIFGDKLTWGVRLRTPNLIDAGQFPKTDTAVELWDLPTATPAWLNPALKEIAKLRQKDLEKHDYELPPGIAALRDRQESELHKTAVLVDEIIEKFAENFSVLVFMQFSRTIDIVFSQLEKQGISSRILDGRQSKKDSAESLELFQQNRCKVLLCQVDAGSESIDLHDTHGDHPRFVFVFPTFKAVTLTQVLGRAVRSGTKSPVTQRLIYAATTLEKKIAKSVERKLDNLSLLSDGELSGEFFEKKSIYIS